MTSPRRTSQAPAPRERGSILVLVLVMAMFAAFALTVFLEKASDQLVVRTREADAENLRLEAYSAMETTLAVLVDFKEALKGLRSSAEGWGDPLEFAGYEPGDGRRITVRFTDESGRLSLPHATYEELVDLFKSWEVNENEAEEIADAMMVWIKPDYKPLLAATPDARDYELLPLPFKPPGRSLRDWAELHSIEGLGEFFFDEDGHPTGNYTRLLATYSLLDYEKPNIHAAGAEVLTSIGGYDEYQQQQLREYLAGDGSYLGKGGAYFETSKDVATLLGGEGNAEKFGVTIQALRVDVTVTEGVSSFTLSTTLAIDDAVKVVSPATVTPAKDAPTTHQITTLAPGETPATAAAQTSRRSAPKTSGKSAASTDQATSKTAQSGSAPGRASAGANDTSLNYPFTLLAVHEHDASTSAPPTTAAEDDLF